MQLRALDDVSLTAIKQRRDGERAGKNRREPHPQENYITVGHIIKGRDKRGTDIFFFFAPAQEQI